MTSYIYALIIVAFAATSYAGGMPEIVSDSQAIIKENKELELEADHETVQIRDLEAEKKMAKEQALVKEQIKKESEKRLEIVKTQRENTLEKAKEDIANWEARRKDAERIHKMNSQEIAKHQAEIKKLEDSVTLAQKLAKDAQDIMVAGREELAVAKTKKDQLEQQNKEAIYAQTKAQGEMQRLRDEWKRVNESIKDLETRVQANQAEAHKREQMIAEGTRKVAAAQAKETALKTQLGIKETQVAVSNSKAPATSTAPATTAAKNDAN